ncbi:MAG: carbamoyltransferase HypF [Bacteroidota bacterium]
MKTWYIHIQGQVQGVGFRPFVYVLAQEFELKGWVNNTTDGVHIQFNGTSDLAQRVKENINSKAPKLARITSIKLEESEQTFFENFQIIHSDSDGKRNLLLTPDFGMCDDCKQELKTSADRRYVYPFITCTNCGPRYSIIHALPYDRVHTKMDVFPMCESCQSEYENPLDRRYYSQTNSCPSCAVQLSLFNAEKQELKGDLLGKVVGAWQAGKIVAIKGIGGYLLTCDANSSSAIQELRKRKHRPSKPFALMCPRLEKLELSKVEKDALESEVSPIVLLNNVRENVNAEGIAPNLSKVGAMLPYTPLYELLLDKFGKPIIATSGNISNSPIVFEDEKALSELTQIADLVLVNNREIVVPQDDSVIQFSPFYQHKITLRRSRGLAPTYINPELKLSSKSILAMGAMLKSTFSLLHSDNIYISQYLGDLAHFDTQQNYQKVIEHFLSLFDTKPETILLDQHPEYPSTQRGAQLAEQWNLPTYSIQHHIAHFGAILGEHNLIHSEEPILGVVWDGTGLGEDGQIWGGEFFKYENYDFLRCYHFDYFDFILGDKMPKEPRVSALSACWNVLGVEDILKEKFNETERKIYTRMLSKENPLQTSSVGRIFDAVASLLGILDKQTYEGEAAMQLEALATTYFQKNGLDFGSSYFQDGAHYYRIPTQSLMTNILMDLRKGKPKDWIAAKFHFSLAHLIKIVANHLKIKKITFSGGVFQNALLVDLIYHHLSPKFNLYFHQELSPNDENISFGQLVVHRIQEVRSKIVH